VPDERLTAAVAELYGADTDAFTDRRKALVAAARAAGDKSAAAAIAALRKPTRAAWVVNRLARDDPSAPPRLAAVTAALRAAERAKDGRRLRELSQARGALIDALTERALAAAGSPDPPPSLRAEVSATLTAALADPAVAAAFAAGTLTRAAHWSGFGAAADWPDSPGAPAEGSAGAEAADQPSADGKQRPPLSRPPNPGQPDTGPPDTGTSPSGTSLSGTPPRRETAMPDGSKGRAGSAPAARSRRGASRPPAPAAVRAAAEEEQRRRAREEAERAAGRLENYRDAERTVASAVTVAAEAVAAEERLEVEVRELERRLIKTRADLASARLHARRAEAAQRRAEQALERLPRD
jgi:hypothetical protein